MSPIIKCPRHEKSSVPPKLTLEKTLVLILFVAVLVATSIVAWLLLAKGFTLGKAAALMVISAVSFMGGRWHGSVDHRIQTAKEVAHHERWKE